MSEEKPKSGRGTKLTLGLVVIGMGVLFAASFQRDVELDGLGRRFLSAVRSDDVAAAYGMLSPSRRARMSEAELGELVDHPAFREHADVWLGNEKAHSGGLCTLGGLNVRGREWGVQLYFREEGDAWWVHSFAIQPPATMQLGTLLPECGYWEGTRVGYSGPGVDRATTPTD